MPSKRDTLLASLPPVGGKGSVSDRLHAQQKAAYSGPDPSRPRSINDLLKANGLSMKTLQ